MLFKQGLGTEEGEGWAGVRVQAEKPAEVTEICCETYCAAPRGLFLGGTADREASLPPKEPPRWIFNPSAANWLFRGENLPNFSHPM